ncbi:hypothetical protein [Pseudomonas sp. SCB32]|uniref:hypothetical protein n=1 Tax=Pseudomonas sp. SCB32 TaxID=2653853 RepID=UPI001264C583|nr:hypothetical protein [Pseudomonas sp. SCB32]
MTTLAVSISAIVALLVALSTHHLTSTRDQKNKRREQRAGYLINTFRVFSRMSNHPAIHEISLEIENAISDIQLFGTKEQINEVQKIVTDLAINKEDSDLNKILTLLRDDLREELGAEPITGDIMWIKISPKKHNP